MMAWFCGPGLNRYRENSQAAWDTVMISRLESACFRPSAVPRPWPVTPMVFRDRYFAWQRKL